MQETLQFWTEIPGT